RGLWATLSIESGAASSAVAAALGHGSFAMTARHYAQPEAVANARSARVGEMMRLGNDAPEDPLRKLSAEELMSRISPGTLAQMMEIFTKTMSGAKKRKTAVA